MSVNRVMLLGRLGDDPVLKHTPTGQAVCNMNLATSETWNDKTSGEKKEKTEWHRVVIWGKQAENCDKFLSKGRQLFVEGKLQTRSWEDKDGNKRYTTEILGTSVDFIGGPNKDLQTNQLNLKAQAAKKDDPNLKVAISADYAADDIPF